MAFNQPNSNPHFGRRGAFVAPPSFRDLARSHLLPGPRLQISPHDQPTGWVTTHPGRLRGFPKIQGYPKLAGWFISWKIPTFTDDDWGFSMK